MIVPIFIRSISEMISTEKGSKMVIIITEIKQVLFSSKFIRRTPKFGPKMSILTKNRHFLVCKNRKMDRLNPGILYPRYTKMSSVIRLILSVILRMKHQNFQNRIPTESDKNFDIPRISIIHLIISNF